MLVLQAETGKNHDDTSDVGNVTSTACCERMVSYEHESWSSVLLTLLQQSLETTLSLRAPTDEFRERAVPVWAVRRATGFTPVPPCVQQNRLVILNS